nr:NADH dehydrogenase subunit 4 [Tubifex tubifex]
MLTASLTMFSTILMLVTSTNYWITMIITLVMLIIWLTPTIIQYSSLTMISEMVAIDPLSATLILLSLWITLLMFMASNTLKMNGNSPKLFSLTVILLSWTLVLCFSASNMMLFYIWFEASLIPTMMLIMLWGYQPERLQASMYLMIYTVTASLPLLLILTKISQLSHHMSLTYPWTTFPSSIMPLLAWLMVTSAFLVKLPLFIVHLWLPKAHVEAPVAGSMILAAILLKLGGYGLLRVSLLFQERVQITSTPIMSIAVMGATITSFICLRQPDLKSLIAYSSVGHMGLMIAGLLSGSSIGMYGAMAMMIAHGLISSGLFCMANMTYEYTHTRSIALTKGLLATSPILSMWWFLMVCANMAAPPSINLLSEILLITATLSSSIILLIPLMLISFFTVAYSLHLFASINHGSPMQITNPLPPLMGRNLLLIILHISPAILLIVMPDLITN